MITHLDFTVNIIIFVEAMEILVHPLDSLSKESEPLGLNVSWIKNKIQ